MATLFIATSPQLLLCLPKRNGPVAHRSWTCPPTPPGWFIKRLGNYNIFIHISLDEPEDISKKRKTINMIKYEVPVGKTTWLNWYRYVYMSLANLNSACWMILGMNAIPLRPQDESWPILPWDNLIVKELANFWKLRSLFITRDSTIY